VRNGCPELKSMVGEIVIARIAALDEKEMVFVRLHRVEASGIWVFSQDFTEAMMNRFKLAVSKTTLVLFVPFAQIDFIVGCVDSVSLSEAALGLKDKNAH